MQLVWFGAVSVCSVRRPRSRRARRRGDGGCGQQPYRRPFADLHIRRGAPGRARVVFMRFVTTRAVQQPVSAGSFGDRDRLPAAGVSLRTAMLEGLAPDGGLYVPESIDLWNAGENSSLPHPSPPEIP